MKRIAKEDLMHVLKHVENIAGALKDKSIFITGATGFFGKWLLESFLFMNKELSLNASVYALSRKPDAFLAEYPFYKNEPAITFIKGDVQTFTFPEGDFQFIIHAATDTDAKSNIENPWLMLDTITKGTERVLKFAAKQPLEALLLTSSGAIYGQQPADISHINEADCFKLDTNNAVSVYGQGKRMAELYCALYNQQFNMPIKIARCFAFVGPYLPLNKHFAIGNFILNGLNKEDIIIKGDGTPCRSYLYAADLAIWLWTILIKGENNKPYNVGSDHDIDIKETAGIVASCFNHKLNIDIVGKPSGLPIQRYVPNINEALTLGLEVKVPVKEAILKTIKFHSSQTLQSNYH
jgi:nucleoside-diphosphate-sugar epimerase